MTVIETRTLRAELYAFVQGAFDNNDDMTTERLLITAGSLMDSDPWFKEQLATEALRMLLPEIARHVRHQRRENAAHVEMGETSAERMARVFEHVGGGLARSLPTMTRPDHLFAAAERESRAAGELRWAGFHRAVAKLHTDDNTPTGDLPQDQVRRLWTQHIGRD